MGSNSNPKEYLGVDVGSARVGVARGSSAARIAEPLTTLAAIDSIDKLKEIAEEYHADGIVVGLPRNLSGKETEQTKLVREWVGSAQAEIAVPFYWQDEALTSKLAEIRDKKNDVDSGAAAIILQDFLNAPASDRVRC